MLTFICEKPDEEIDVCWFSHPERHKKFKRRIRRKNRISFIKWWHKTFTKSKGRSKQRYFDQGTRRRPSEQVKFLQEKKDWSSWKKRPTYFEQKNQKKASLTMNNILNFHIWRVRKAFKEIKTHFINGWQKTFTKIKGI